MSTEPISVTVKNLTTRARPLRWLAKGVLWIESNGTVHVPYEPWSCADNVQRQYLQTEIETDMINLTLNVTNSDGVVFNIPYRPGCKLLQEVSLPNVTVTAAEKHEIATEITVPKNNVIETQRHTDTIFAEETDKHNFVIPTKHGDAFDGAFSISAPEHASIEHNPNVDLQGPAAKAGFSINNMAASDHSITGVSWIKQLQNKQGAAAQILNAPSTQAIEIPAETPGEQTSDAKNTRVASEAAFTALVEAKDWTGALQYLIDIFGKDQVTFTARTIMSMKSLSAIVTKYNLH